jgi:hypothetical protein
MQAAAAAHAKLRLTRAVNAAHAKLLEETRQSSAGRTAPEEGSRSR